MLNQNSDLNYEDVLSILTNQGFERIHHVLSKHSATDEDKNDFELWANDKVTISLTSTTWGGRKKPNSIIMDFQLDFGKGDGALKKNHDFHERLMTVSGNSTFNRKGNLIGVFSLDIVNMSATPGNLIDFISTYGILMEASQRMNGMSYVWPQWHSPEIVLNRKIGRSDEDLLKMVENEKKWVKTLPPHVKSMLYPKNSAEGYAFFEKLSYSLEKANMEMDKTDEEKVSSWLKDIALSQVPKWSRLKSGFSSYEMVLWLEPQFGEILAKMLEMKTWEEKLSPSERMSIGLARLSNITFLESSDVSLRLFRSGLNEIEIITEEIFEKISKLLENHLWCQKNGKALVDEILKSKCPMSYQDARKWLSMKAQKTDLGCLLLTHCEKVGLSEEVGETQIQKPRKKL